MRTARRRRSAFHELVKRHGRGGLRDRLALAARARCCTVEQTSKRQFASRVFHLIVQVLFWMNIRDTQCGAKVHAPRRRSRRSIPALRIADMAFDINLLYSLKRAGFRILEVPTEWTDKIGSKVALFRTSLTMFLSVVRHPADLLAVLPWLRPLRPLEGWVYSKLRAPQPRPEGGAVTAPGAADEDRGSSAN